MMAVPYIFMAPLMPNPDTVPYFAVDSGAAALKIFGAFTLIQAATFHCLADAALKGNLAKSDTYKCALSRRMPGTMYTCDPAITDS